MSPARLTKPVLATVAATAVLAVLAILAIAQPDADAATPLSAPVIHETFTPLGCPKSKAEAQTTLGMEGCSEQAILKTDAQIDAVAKKIFSMLGTDAARRRFVTAQRAWLTYRNADCASVSDKYAGGTLAGVLAAGCTSQRTTRHLTEIRAFEKLLQTP
ncbi:MAG TPA: lysozyme inhibitor LprI family protein [Solirubrobacteraceae bacterium]